MTISTYVTVSEFRNAPTGIDVTNIVPDGTIDENLAELRNILERASEWVNAECEMETLEATENVEIVESRVSRRGDIVVHPKMFPIVALKRVQYRFHPTHEWRDVDISYIDVYERKFVIRGLSYFGFADPTVIINTAFNYRTPSDMAALNRLPLMLRIDYVNGWPVTEIADDVLAEATTITVDDPIGIVAGQRLTIYDDAKTETVVVESIVDDAVTLRKPLEYDHDAGVGISALPASVKQATILFAASLIKQRGSTSVTMSGSPSTMGANPYDQSDLRTAKDLLRKFKRVVVV